MEAKRESGQGVVHRLCTMFIIILFYFSKIEAKHLPCSYGKSNDRYTLDAAA